ncbi:MAG: hypothetical protein ACMUIE_05810 [Thermoplasmatota archaeon]
MDDVEKTKQEALVMLRSIQTLEGFKEHKEDIIKFLEEMLGTSVMALKELMTHMMGMSEEEKMENLMKLQGQDDLFGPEIDEELQRISEIPGVDEHFDTFQAEFEERLNPYIEDLMQSMETAMGQLMGGMMGGIAEAGMGMMEGMEEALEKEDLQSKVYDDPYREKVYGLWPLYYIDSIETLEENKPQFYEDMDQALVERIENLNIMKEMGFPASDAEDKVEYCRGVRTEFEIEIERISRIPGSEDHVREMKEYYEAKVVPGLKEMESIIAALK